VNQLGSEHGVAAQSALFVFFTFCFIVLFEYGTHDFVPGFQKEFARIKSFVVSQTDKATHRKK
jgi:hypothetical protein